MSSVYNVNISRTMSVRADSTHYIAYLHTMHTLLYIYGGIQSRHYRKVVKEDGIVLTLKDIDTWAFWRWIRSRMEK